MVNKFEAIELNPTDMLVTPLTEYYKTKDQKAFDSNVHQEGREDVGVIEHVGPELPQERVGKIIYYKENTSTLIDLKDIGKYEVVNENYKILIRSDQSADNY